MTASSLESLKETLKNATRETTAQRFQMELEFVQLLSNPHYLINLARNRYLEQPAFLNYLRYLEYWKTSPYTNYLTYPVCLNVLEFLKDPQFRQALLVPGVAEVLERQILAPWVTYYTPFDDLGDIPSQEDLAKKRAERDGLFESEREERSRLEKIQKRKREEGETGDWRGTAYRGETETGDRVRKRLSREGDIEMTDALVETVKEETRLLSDVEMETNIKTMRSESQKGKEETGEAAETAEAGERRQETTVNSKRDVEEEREEQITKHNSGRQETDAGERDLGDREAGDRETGDGDAGPQAAETGETGDGKEGGDEEPEWDE
eukprot:Platyproteum_vivax@DN16292_c0_g1_i1.p1